MKKVNGFTIFIGMKLNILVFLNGNSNLKFNIFIENIHIKLFDVHIFIFNQQFRKYKYLICRISSK